MARTLSTKTVTAREKRGRVFLRALAAGNSAVTAAKAAGVALSTLYKWRGRDAAFRAAWDEAATIREEARVEHLDDQLMRRAVECIEDPVMHNGAQVAARKRYSDALLMFAIRELRGRRKEDEREAERRKAERAAPARPPEIPSADSRITVVVRQFALPAAGPPTLGPPTLDAALPAPAQGDGGDE